mgnify:CR=1 FL=1
MRKKIRIRKSKKGQWILAYFDKEVNFYALTTENIKVPMIIRKGTLTKIVVDPDELEKVNK